MRRGLDAFHEDADAWRAAVGSRAPVYDRLLAAAAAIFDHPAGSLEEAARARVEAAWRERRLSPGYDRPLLLMAALRAEALRAGPRHPLFESIGATNVCPEAATREALAAALADAPPRLYAELATRRVQTNETSRAVVWLWPAALAGCGDGKRPLALFDVGCSAGLNLGAERLPAPWRDPAGAPIPVVAAATIVARHGFDVQPLDVERPEDINWLRACVWPGENARLDRLAAAVDAFRALASGPTPPRLEIADLVDVPARLERLAQAAAPETVMLAYQTVVRDYLTEASRARYIEGMTGWVAAESPAGPRRIWIELEAAPDAWKDPGGLPMSIDAHVADGGRAATLTLAHCSYHAYLPAPDPAAVASFIERSDLRSPRPAKRGEG
jgi:hypothetical protein